MSSPLIVIPVSSLYAWHGCTEDGMVLSDGPDPDDYERACAVNDLAGTITVGGSESGLKAAAEAVLTDPAAQWEECGTWTTDGPAVLMDSAEAGTDLNVEYPYGGLPAQAAVSLAAGHWRVRATHTKADEENWVGLVQLLAVGG
ncbi:Imm21 family immunity protein [Streptomyces sp. NPDC059575]|uniref:Imm21 family immunity protein n=1 Tax=Streptomyces sp. NPDC059575 TaxID=3346872 RepID=UPI00369B793B